MDGVGAGEGCGLFQEVYVMTKRGLPLSANEKSSRYWRRRFLEVQGINVSI